MATFHPLTVTDIRRETRDSVVLSLAVPDEQKETFRFTQGQYLTFRTWIDGEEVRRSYSICAGVHEPFSGSASRRSGTACSRPGPTRR